MENTEIQEKIDDALNHGNWQRAIDLCDAALNIDTDDWAAQMKQGLAYHRQGNYRQAGVVLLPLCVNLHQEIVDRKVASKDKKEPADLVMVLIESRVILLLGQYLSTCSDPRLITLQAMELESRMADLSARGIIRNADISPLLAELQGKLGLA